VARQVLVPGEDRRRAQDTGLHRRDHAPVARADIVDAPRFGMAPEGVLHPDLGRPRFVAPAHDFGQG
jgi:hypothetical protein